jgi:hypothetical protein
MPKKKGRGRVLRTRTVKTDGKYMTCDIYEKPGPQGGRTVCSSPNTHKNKKHGSAEFGSFMDKRRKL